MIRNIPTATIGQLLSEQYPFFVPIYQRAYAWEDGEIDDFINDIRVLYDSRVMSPPNKQEHFFGGMVCVHHFVNNRTNRQHEVVDGQQRLATFTLTLKLLVLALRNLAASQKDEGGDVAQEAIAHADQMEEDYIEYWEVDGGKKTQRQRLTLSKADAPYFRQLLAGVIPSSPTRESHRRLKSAFEKIQGALINPILTDSSIADKEKLIRLLALHDSIANDCQVIHIVCDDRRKAYQLFSVLNDRGTTLSDGDLLRAYSLELLEEHPDLQEDIEKYWDKILSGNNTTIDRFLRTYYPSHVGDRAPQRDLADAYRKQFFNYPEPIGLEDIDGAQSVKNRIENMSLEYELYLKLSEGEWPYEQPRSSGWQRDRLKRLVQILRHELCLPLLLSAYCLTEERFADLVFTLERFVFRYITIVRAHANTLYRPYNENAVRIRNEPDNYSDRSLIPDLKALIEERANGEQFLFNLEEELIYSSSSTTKRVIKHFLTTLEDFHTWFNNGANGTPHTNQMSSFDINQITIEHIYPNSAETSIPELESVKHRIGNLAFWAPRDNRSAENRPFVEKRDRYGQSNVLMTRELADNSDWMIEQYEQRKQKLHNMALAIFSF